MTTLKSLILGSAAGLIAIGGAQAADLPLKAKAVEYVKVCSLYGAGFYYIPGTDTCLKIGGYVRADWSANSSSVYSQPMWSGVGASATRARDNFEGRYRANLNMDTRTATEYGVVRTYANVQFQWSDVVTTGDGIAGGALEMDYAFIQFAGFTFGKAVSQFDTQWVLAQPSISSGFTGGSDNKTGIPQVAYTASFGNGVSATISAETPRPYRRGFVYNTATSVGLPGLTAPTDSTSGQFLPDFVANLRLDQAWGSLHAAAAVHQVAASYNVIGNDASGHPDDKYGFAVIGGFEIKNLPTGAGDTLRGDFTYANGATKYVFGGTSNTTVTGFQIWNNNSLVLANYQDAVFNGAVGGSLQLSNDWSARLFYEHYWNPAWRTSLWGLYARHEQTAEGDAALLAAYNRATNATANGLGGALTGSTNFSVVQIGSRTAWTPVQNLTFSVEALYTQINSGLSGTVTPATANFYTNKPIGTYTVGNQSTWTGSFQVLRSF